MTTPLGNLFWKIRYKSGEVSYDDINKANDEYDARISLIKVKDRNKFDYIKSILKDVGNIAILDVAIGQYDKLLSETQDCKLKKEEEQSRSSYYHLHGQPSQVPMNNTSEQTERQRTRQNEQTQSRTKSQQDHQVKKQSKERIKRDVDDLSKHASYQMKKNNPNIADLSDGNRPTKIAERYSELYDNEWTEAFECLTKTLRKADKDCIQILYQIISEAYRFGIKRSEGQLTRMYNSLIEIMETGKTTENYDTKQKKEASNEEKSLLRQIRKDKATNCIENLQKEFTNEHLCTIIKDLKVINDQTAIETYIKKCIDIAWWMCVQDPPVEMCDIDADPATIDTSKYRAYTRSGFNIDFIVWPCVVLYKDGPVLCKGVAQFK